MHACSGVTVNSKQLTNGRVFKKGLIVIMSRVSWSEAAHLSELLLIFRCSMSRYAVQSVLSIFFLFFCRAIDTRLRNRSVTFAHCSQYIFFLLPIPSSFIDELSRRQGGVFCIELHRMPASFTLYIVKWAVELHRTIQYLVREEENRGKPHNSRRPGACLDSVWSYPLGDIFRYWARHWILNKKKEDRKKRKEITVSSTKYKAVWTKGWQERCQMQHLRGSATWIQGARRKTIRKAKEKRASIQTKCDMLSLANAAIEWFGDSAWKRKEKESKSKDSYRGAEYQQVEPKTKQYW